MPRYYFHITDLAASRTPDDEGMELPNLQAAIIEARVSARDLAGALIRAGKPVDGQKIIVANAQGNTIHELAVKDIIKDLGH